MKVKCTNIQWDTTSDEPEPAVAPELPTEMVIEMESDPNMTDDENVAEFGADALSDQYGFCVFGFCFEIIR
jgi:hypothetical protein